MRLDCSDISYTYPEGDLPVLERVSCSFSRPGFHAVFGPSGVGKSSFARLIASPDSFQFQGEISSIDISTILYSFNLERLPGWASTGTHLSKVIAQDKRELKEELVQIFELQSLLDSRFHQLSMGQQNRVNLIRYLLQDFNLLIMDESLANVDEKLRKTIICAIKKLFTDKMLLYISHNLMEVATFCDQILVFGAKSEKKSYTMVKGQNCRHEKELDNTLRDRTMLEIMNAF